MLMICWHPHWKNSSECGFPELVTPLNKANRTHALFGTQCSTFLFANAVEAGVTSVLISTEIKPNVYGYSEGSMSSFQLFRTQGTGHMQKASLILIWENVCKLQINYWLMCYMARAFREYRDLNAQNPEIRY